ncbi:ABC transporter permease [Catalinimonas niigatensis]|uniref:ABC transporter permease n=1 Tax=Catalinimonas niigatensis TaxID=1397264 RepID=UPI002666365E|nr:ABC transporter permease [Catalinimonas niigatensis]WPP48004.1 ABC transporter permease [Catalinimonas niigatensis]
MFKIFKFTFFDLMRSRWSIIYFLFYLLCATGLLYFSNDLSKGIISLMNIIIVLSPLVSIMFGVIYYYSSREFVELLLAQPIRRTSIFGGQYLGLALSLSLSLLLGLGLPFLLYGIFVSAQIWNFFTLLLTGLLLTFIFTAIAFWISLKNENRVKGFGLALLVWLFMAVLYDGVFLLLLLAFEDYPVDKFAIAFTLFNPIDLSRILMMLKLDISALLGYTGAVFNKFFGTSLGIALALLCSLVWILIPLWGAGRTANRKDF